MNVFLVESPLQYLNAISAKNHFKINDNEAALILNDNGNDENLNQIIYLLNKKIVNWSKVTIIKNTTIFLKYNSIKKELKLYLKSNIKRLFIGDYFNALFRAIDNHYKITESFILDDGISTLRISQKLQDKERFGSENFVKRKLKKIISFNDESKKEHTFFTVYDISEKTKNYKVIKNKYAFFRNVVKSIKISDYKIFIGGPLSEKNIVTEEYYLKLLNKFVNTTKGKIVYIPHRHEDNRKISEIEEMGFEILKLNTSIEFEIIIGTIQMPSHVYSFFSSALININVMLDTKGVIVKSIYIDSDKLCQRKENVVDAYHYIKQYIDVIEL